MSSQQHSVRTRRRRRADADAAFGVKRGNTLCPQCGERRLPFKRVPHPVREVAL